MDWFGHSLRHLPVHIRYGRRFYNLFLDDPPDQVDTSFFHFLCYTCRGHNRRLDLFERKTHPVSNPRLIARPCGDLYLDEKIKSKIRLNPFFFFQRPDLFSLDLHCLYGISLAT